MDKIKDSLTFLFKEKNWALKMLLPFALTLLISLPSIFTDNSTLSFNSNGYLRSSYNTNSATALFSAIVSCIVCLLVIPTLIVGSWHTYESTQSGIQKRATTTLWGANFADKLKRSLKYLLASTIYGLVIGTIVALIAGVFLIAIMLLSGGAFSTNGLSSLNNLNGIYLLLVCFFGILFLAILAVLAVLSYFIVTPGLLRLVATNTFSEAFKLKDNWDLAMRHKPELLGLLLVSIATGFVVGILGGVGGAIAGVFSLVSPILFTFAMFVVNYVSTVISTYYSFFFYPRFSGLVFRDIIESDSSLSYISTKAESK